MNAVFASWSATHAEQVIDGVGLAVMLYEVFEISEGFVYHGEVLFSLLRNKGGCSGRPSLCICAVAMARSAVSLFLVVNA